MRPAPDPFPHFWPPTTSRSLERDGRKIRAGNRTMDNETPERAWLSYYGDSGLTHHPAFIRTAGRHPPCIVHQHPDILRNRFRVLVAVSDNAHSYSVVASDTHSNAPHPHRSGYTPGCLLAPIPPLSGSLLPISCAQFALVSSSLSSLVAVTNFAQCLEDFGKDPTAIGGSYKGGWTHLQDLHDPVWRGCREIRGGGVRVVVSLVGPSLVGSHIPTTP